MGHLPEAFCAAGKASQHSGNILLGDAGYLGAPIIAQNSLNSFRQSLFIDAAISEEVGQFPGVRVGGMADIGETGDGELVLGMKELLFYLVGNIWSGLLGQQTLLDSGCGVHGR